MYVCVDVHSTKEREHCAHKAVLPEFSNENRSEDKKRVTLLI